MRLAKGDPVKTITDGPSTPITEEEGVEKVETEKSDAHEEGNKQNAHEIGRSAEFHTSYFYPIPSIPSRQVNSLAN